MRFHKFGVIFELHLGLMPPLLNAYYNISFFNASKIYQLLYRVLESLAHLTCSLIYSSIHMLTLKKFKLLPCRLF